ncbi:hypothetical protein [Embleya sp. NBC_00896]|uniref:hypothetical protein n=1 Tax=Embleya sp. NBC_00896 TaxID=2975961 RepID=UPI002F9103A6|nr:hypothetical protein OG928_48670 [Embleya sp. NBC_00896]
MSPPKQAYLEYQVSLTLGLHAEEFDIPGIVADLIADHNSIQSVDDVDSDDYWDVVREHDRDVSPIDQFRCRRQ